MAIAAVCKPDTDVAPLPSVARRKSANSDDSDVPAQADWRTGQDFMHPQPSLARPLFSFMRFLVIHLSCSLAARQESDSHQPQGSCQPWLVPNTCASFPPTCAHTYVVTDSTHPPGKPRPSLRIQNSDISPERSASLCRTGCMKKRRFETIKVAEHFSNYILFAASASPCVGQERSS